MGYQLSERERHWTKAQFGLEYLQEGLAPFCNDIVKQQHKDILENIKQTKNLTTAVCDQCNVTTLRPDHARKRKNKCPLGHHRCNCCRRASTYCPNEVCGAIYDEIAEYHTSTPSWNNTKAQQWTSDPWSIARCFFKTNGCSSAAKTGISGLLELIWSNNYFHENITRMDLISRVRQHKKNINRSSNMQLDKLEADMYIDDMIAILQDDKKLKYRTDVQKVVKKLQTLKNSNDTAEDNSAVDDCNRRFIKQDEVRQMKMLVLNSIRNIIRDNLDILQEKDEEIYRDVQNAVKNMVNTKKSGHSQQEPGNNEESKSGTKIRVDGRLIKLEEQDISILKEEYTHLIGKGSFGKVYSTSDDTVPADFGIRIALKKIKLCKEEAKNRLVRREMIASRILHPFILPLLAVDYRPSGLEEVWFVSPLCENSDLRTAIKEKVLKKQRTRLKILFHVALAIRYLHTEVPNVRKAILHKDIASKNVVLDAECNARLIDFGLAREIDDDTATATERSYYRHPYDGTGVHATVSWDYYSFGVIIREMLTSLGPKGDVKNGKRIYLTKMNSKEVRDSLSKDIWKYEDGASVLANIAEVCLEELDLRLSEFNTKVVEKIKKIWWRDLNQDRLLDVPDGHAKCHICMINPMATKTSMRQDHARNCRQKIETCIACEKNSFLNPVRCYCDKDLKPTIGSRCGALLVAGNDENEKLAEVLKKDINNLKKVITSRAPLIMGISEDMVRMVVPNKLGTLGAREKLWPEVRKHIEFFSKEAEIDTLLIYFSCHGAKCRDGGDIKSQSNVFQLASPSDSITLDEFKKELDCLGNIDKLIIIQDRCYPQKITMNEDRKFIQINACHEKQRAKMTEDCSIFTKYFIQGLKAKSDKKICDSDCKDCDTYWSEMSDFISITRLFDYVSDHMSKYADSQPDGNTSLQWKNIAYYTHEKVEIDFTWQQDDPVQKQIPLEFLQTMRQLEEKLCKVFERDTSTTKVKIQKDTFRERERLQDCDTLEKVMSAWVNRQPLTVKFENS